MLFCILGIPSGLEHTCNDLKALQEANYKIIGKRDQIINLEILE